MEGKNRFIKIFSLLVTSMLLSTIMCIAAPASQAQRLKSYDELKELYEKIVGTSSNGISIEKEIAPSAAPVPAPTAPSAARSDASASGSVSTTNVQVAGVDEGDIIKNNGNYIFTVTSKYEGYNNYSIVNIISTHRTGAMKVVGSFKVEGTTHEMYLKGNKLVLITHPQDVYLDLTTNKHITIQDYNKANPQWTAEAQRRYQYKSRTAALVYDVGNPAKPRYERRVMQDGDYLSSRLIGNQLYMVTNRYNFSYVTYQKASEINPYAIVPLIRDSAVSGDPYKMLEPRFICIFPNLVSFNFAVVTGFDISSTRGAVSCEATLGGGSNIYASQNNLYVMSENYGGYSGGRMIMPTTTDTNIMKYSLSGGVPRVSAIGKVPGSILNQFSVDEYDGNFRVATTTGSTWGSSTSKNNVYVLNSSLDVIGKIENLAPGERIYSVRFMDKKGYVVTFRQVDPLFALDLSNPAKPRVTGQLKIPGFSNYLHPYSQNILIGIGNTTTETSGATLTDGLKLSLFDVSNPFNPREIKNYVLGTRGTYSEVQYNHKALLFSKEKNILGFPVQLYEKKAGSPSSYGTLTYNGYYVFNIDVNKGFSVRGRVTHLSGTQDPNYGWDSGLNIKRGVFVDDTLYTISDNLVKANSLKDFKLIQQVKLPN